MKTLDELPLDQVRPSKTNPRKDFESPGALAYLHELAGTIRQKGVLQPILARPDYCVGAATHAVIEAKRRPLVEWWEIIAGECRWRSSKIANTCDGNRPAIPAVVTEMTDDDAREAQQIENLQRRDLSPLEEAHGIDDMLTLHNDDGTPRYTVERLAERLGHEVDWVHKRRALLGLPGVAMAALEKGVLSVMVARLIPTVPVPEAREEFARKILKPDLEEGPLSYARAKELRDEHFVKVLKGAPFALEDAELVKGAGACTACLKMSGNRPELAAVDETAAWKQHTCLDPVCYRSKIAALQKKQVSEAEKTGKLVLPPEECAKVYPFFTADGEMDPRSIYAPIGRKPAEHLVKKEVTRVPTWEKLVAEAEEKTGAKVPRVLIADQTGAVREHVEVRLAIAAIEKAGEPIFREMNERRPKASGDPFALQKKAELERGKVQWAVAKASLDAVWEALLKGWDSAAVWDALFFTSLVHAGEQGLGLIAKWRGLALGDGEFARADAVEKWWRSLPAAERDAVVPVLLVSMGMKESGAAAEDFTNLARALKVDLAAVEKKTVQEFKAKEKGARLKPAELEEKVREMMREKKVAAAIAAALGLSQEKCARIVSKIEKEEAAAKLTTDPKILAEWVKAEANGMPLEEIARSYKVDIEDVRGALSAARTPRTKHQEPRTKDQGEKPAARPKGRALSAAEMKELSERYAGKPASEIAFRFGISVPLAKWYAAAKGTETGASVANMPALNNENAASGVVSEEKYLAAKTLMNAGKLWPKICEQLGLSPAQGTTVYKRYREEEAVEYFEAKTKPEKKSNATKPSAAAMEAQVRALRTKGKNFTEIYLETGMPRARLKKLLKAIDAEKGAAAK